MATNKKGFVLYCDLLETVKKLPNEKAGELFKHILEYVNDNNPETEDLVLSIAFEPIKQQLKRDLKKYKNICERNRANGLKGGRPKKPKKPSGLSGNPKKPKKPDTDKDKDKDKDIKFNFFWSKYPKKVAKDKCKDKFFNLKESEIETILNTIDKYINYKPFEEYTHPNPLTYLNQRRWQDEIPEEEKKPKTGAEIYAENVMRQINANK